MALELENARYVISGEGLILCTAEQNKQNDSSAIYRKCWSMGRGFAVMIDA